MNISVPIGHEIGGISFSFVSSEQVKKLSVKSLNNPITFDPISNHPNSNGVYDPALGPTDRHQLCATCKLSHQHCPGHFGHIDLAVPIYHPLLFNTMVSLLKATCMYCHSFRLKDIKVYRFLARFKLLQAGLVSEAIALETLDFSMELNEKSDKDDEELDAVMDYDTVANAIDSYVEKAFSNHDLDMKNPRHTHSAPVTLSINYLSQVTKEFFHHMGHSKKCENCGGMAAAIRTESGTKIFEVSLNKKFAAIMESQGMRRQSVFGTREKDRVTETDSESDTGETEEEMKSGDAAGKAYSNSNYLTPLQVRNHLQLLWEKEQGILDSVLGVCPPGQRNRKSSSDNFFLDCILVPPAAFRPISRMGDKVFDHPQNTYLNAVIKFNNAIVALRAQEKENNRDISQVDNSFKLMISSWVSLQENANWFIDSSKNSKLKMPPAGIKQVMEKKEGLFRKHMMGKRVNFSARSVISPDPMIETSEIGIPMVFAKKLTFPEPVTQYNAKEMRQAIINGPETYPGATSVEHEDGTLTILQKFDRDQRVALANQLLTPASNLSVNASEHAQFINKKVHRHLRNGDMLLLNRQPTLHKPSIMGHIARVLPGEKTIRMHYANCNTYNADFDGDEMNIHFPQNYIAQAEARLIANTNNQYLVPTSGEPLRGLIQDHVVTGVLMTARDTVLDRRDYTQLVYGALPESDRRIELLPPAYIKPHAFWTGKQVVSTILKNLTLGREPLNLESKSQVPGKSWAVMQAVDTEEGEVTIIGGELLTGVLDKKQFGAKSYGLVHACFEVYGPDTAGQLLTALGRLFTRYVQMIGFTCRMDDLVLTPEADKLRRERIEAALKSGKEILKEFAFGDEQTTENRYEESPLEKRLKTTIASENATEKAKEDARKALEVLEEKRLFQSLEIATRSDEKLAQLDSKMKGKTGEVTTGIVKSVIPNGLYKPFPDNGMQLMTVSGAKGSNVNVTQISCMLGQQELEGRRVPVMVSGKTLPSFRAYDLGPRAGGYITGRFLTGIKPQEYFFHCMAGREGLVDTAVKTARSGYLQRCLIKHLEGLKVNYDQTVRDSADGSIYQFHYGEDSLDVTKSSYLKKFKFNALNYQAFVQKYNPQAAASAIDCRQAAKYQKKALKKPEKYDPALSVFSPARYLGSVSEGYQSSLRNYIDDNPDQVILGPDEEPRHRKLPKEAAFEALMHLKYLHSLIEPGEAVGLLAAQSIGEPSTQMTLNTFHFAGHGAKNVTLGIPRLREIIMTASDKPKTPQMTIPFKKNITKQQAQRLCSQMSRLTLDMIMQGADVTERFLPKRPGDEQRIRSYTITLRFIPRDEYAEEYELTSDQLQSTLTRVFVKRLVSTIKQEMKGSRSRGKEEENAIGQGADTSNFKESLDATTTDEESDDRTTRKRGKKDTAGSGDEDEDDDGGDGDATSARSRMRRTQQSTYDESEDEDDEHSVVVDDASVIDNNDVGENENDSQYRDDIVNNNQFIREYRFDQKDGAWCEFELHFPANEPKMLLVGLVERVAPKCIVREIPHVVKCFVNENKENGQLYMITEGVNIQGMWSFSDFLDIHGIQSNDVASIRKAYGVEAARATVMREISSVFAVYGIEVDTRHLSLIADYMTFEGGYRPFNRMGIANNASPFAKMTFETSFKFLVDAALKGETDRLRNPSARLVVGKVVEGGTGSFEILQPLQ